MKLRRAIPISYALANVTAKYFFGQWVTGFIPAPWGDVVFLVFACLSISLFLYKWLFRTRHA